MIFPVSKFPASVQPLLELLPITALTGGLRSVLSEGAALPLGPALVLLVWAAVTLALAARTFRWE